MITALTFDDIQLVPQYSEIESRKDVQLSPKPLLYKLPIIASPMDTVCGWNMMNALDNNNMVVGALHRFMSMKDRLDILTRFPIKSNRVDRYIIVSIGVQPQDYRDVDELLDYWTTIFDSDNESILAILIDVAHGDHILVRRMIEYIKSHKHNNDQVQVIGGSVSTFDGAYNVFEWGADGVRCGQGNGCFTPDMEVLTSEGLKKISDIEIGDIVLTHTGEYKEVIDTMAFDRDEEIMEINGIECTKNHEFYVVHTKHFDYVNEDNIHQYAEWIEAGDLTDDYLLINLD